MGSPAPSEFPTLAEILSHSDREAPAAGPIVALCETSSVSADLRPTLPEGSVVATLSATAIEVTDGTSYTATLDGLTELVRSSEGDVLLVSSSALPARADVSGLVRSLASDSVCTTVSLDDRSRPAAPGLPPPALDAPRPGVVLVRRDDLLLAADEADLASSYGDRPSVTGCEPLVGSVLSLLDRPGFVHRAFGAESHVAGAPEGSSPRRRRAAEARILVDGSFLAHRLAGTQVQALALVRALVGRARTSRCSVPARSIPRSRRLSRARRADSRSGARAGRTAGRRPPDVADPLPPRARRPARDRRAVRAHAPGHDLGPDAALLRRGRDARLPSRDRRGARARRPRGLLLAPRGARRRERRWPRARSRDGRPARRRPSRRRERSRGCRAAAGRQALPPDGRQLLPSQEPGLLAAPARPARRRRLGRRARPRRRRERLRDRRYPPNDASWTRTRRWPGACGRSVTSRNPSSSRSTATPSSSSFPPSTKGSASSPSRRRPSARRPSIRDAPRWASSFPAREPFPRSTSTRWPSTSLGLLGQPEERARIVAEISARAATLTWDRTAAGYLEVYERALEPAAASVCCRAPRRARARESQAPSRTKRYCSTSTADAAAADLSWTRPFASGRRASRGAEGSAGAARPLADAAADEGPQDAEAVERRELLALLARAGGVRDRHLVDPLAGAKDPGSDLRLDPEASLAQARGNGRAPCSSPCGRSSRRRCSSCRSRSSRA